MAGGYVWGGGRAEARWVGGWVQKKMFASKAHESIPRSQGKNIEKMIERGEIRYETLEEKEGDEVSRSTRG